MERKLHDAVLLHSCEAFVHAGVYEGRKKKMNKFDDGDSFAAVSCFRSNNLIELKEIIKDDIVVVNSPPFDISKFWHEQLGSLQCEEISEADLFFVIKERNNQTGSSNAVLEKCQNLFYSFLIATPFSTDLPPKIYTGNTKNGITNFKSISEFEHPKKIIGIENPDIDKSIINKTIDIYNSMSELIYRKEIKGRIIWALNCFLTGLTGNNIYEKQRNFIRTIEAFILPNQGQTKRNFKSRTELFIGNGYHEYIDLMYEVRSRIEHLHDPLEIIEGKNNDTKFNKLLEIVASAEIIARYCLGTFILNPQIWNCFESDNKINDFWKRDGKEKRKLWGKELNLEKEQLVLLRKKIE